MVVWVYYISSNQFLIEFCGLMRSYLISGEMVQEVYSCVMNDFESNCSWNLVWLCFMKICDDGLVGVYVNLEVLKLEMWGGRLLIEDEVN